MCVLQLLSLYQKEMHYPLRISGGIGVVVVVMVAAAQIYPFLALCSRTSVEIILS